MIIKWLHAPGHAGSIGPKVVQLARNLDPLIIDWSEAYWNVDDIRENAKNYHHFVGPPVRFDARKRPVGHDVVISVREDAKVVHQESFFVSGEFARVIKYFPERHGKAVVLEYQDLTILGVFWHPHPVPFKFPKVLAKYKRGMDRVNEVQRRLEERFEPDLVLSGGDLQLGEGNQWVNPNSYASRNKMWYRHHRIDWQMWKSKMFANIYFHLINPAKVNKGMDHIWTMLGLQREDKA